MFTLILLFKITFKLHYKFRYKTCMFYIMKIRCFVFLQMLHIWYKTSKIDVMYVMISTDKFDVLFRQQSIVLCWLTGVRYRKCDPLLCGYFVLLVPSLLRISFSFSYSFIVNLSLSFFFIHQRPPHSRTADSADSWLDKKCTLTSLTSKSQINTIKFL